MCFTRSGALAPADSGCAVRHLVIALISIVVIIVIIIIIIKEIIVAVT